MGRHVIAGYLEEEEAFVSFFGISFVLIYMNAVHYFCLN